MIKISIQQVKDYFNTNEITLKKEIVVLRVIGTLLAFSFLFFFLFIEDVPVAWLLIIYGFFTASFIKISLVLIATLSILAGFVEKDWSLSVIVLVFLIGQVMFINVFTDKYSLGTEEKVESLMNEDHMPKFYYSDLWNFG